MDLNDLRETSNFDDRRGQFGGAGWGGGFGGFPVGIPIRGGGLGFIGFIILMLLFNSGGGGLFSGGNDYQSGNPTGVEQSGTHRDEAEFDFARKIVWSAEQVWAPILKDRGVTFSPATITFYDYQTPTACGTGQSSA